MDRGERWEAMVARQRDGYGEAHRQGVTAADDPVAQALDAALFARSGQQSLTGRPVVTRHTAMGLPVARRCASMISTDIGRLPISATDGGDWPLLAEPEPGSTRVSVIESTVLGLVWDGNVVWRVTDRDRMGVPAAVQVVPNEDLWIHLDSWTRRITAYRWRSMEIPMEDVIHFRGLGLPGWPVGLSALAALEQTIGSGLGQDQAAAEMLISGWLPMVVLSPRDPDQGLTGAEVAQYREAWGARAGRDRGVMVVPGDMTASTLSFDPRRLQLLESREHNDRQICSAFGVPPHMAGVPSGDSMTYSNVQQDQAHYKARALMGWIGRIEATLSAQLPLGVDAVIDDTELDRGDPHSAAQVRLVDAQAAAQLVAAGIISADEARAKLGWEGPAPAAAAPPNPGEAAEIARGGALAPMQEAAAA